MVRDISSKLPRPQASVYSRPPLSAETRAWLGMNAARAARALFPTLVLALAAGMLGWLAATAAAAVHLAPGVPPLVAGFRLARWTFVAGLTHGLLRYGTRLERRRWRRQPTAA